MGKIIYNPKDEKDIQENNKVNDGNILKFDGEKENMTLEKRDNLKLVGEITGEYSIYIEDYVYTYLYQYASLDLSYEQSALFIGKRSKENKEITIWGVMPVGREYLVNEDEWINEEALLALQERKEMYFKNSEFVGWMHMQPGYGTMLTMKEVRVHRENFKKEGSVLLLLDPINKIETFFVYDEEELKEQSGYYMYYERNDAMQKYMVEYPINGKEKKEECDVLANHFRELGKQRKQQYVQRKKANLTVLTASIALIALAAVVTKVTDQQGQIKLLKEELKTVGNDKAVVANGEGVQVVIESTPTDGGAHLQNQELVNEAESYPNVQVQVEGDFFEKDDTEGVALETDNQKTLKNIDLQEEKEVTTNHQLVDKTIGESKGEDTAVEREVAEKETSKDKEGEDYVVYTVKEGDTLLKISYNYYKTESMAREIAQYNQMTNTDHISIGQIIKLPKKNK